MDADQSPGDELFLSTAMPCAGKNTFASPDPVLLTTQLFTDLATYQLLGGFHSCGTRTVLFIIIGILGDGGKLEKYVKC